MFPPAGAGVKPGVGPQIKKDCKLKLSLLLKQTKNNSFWVCKMIYTMWLDML